MAPMLDEAGLLSSDYFYILPPPSTPNSSVDTLLAQLDGRSNRGSDSNNDRGIDGDSSLTRLLSGSAQFDPVVGFQLASDETDDPFLEAWKRMSASDVQKLNAMLPPTAMGSQGQRFQAPLDYFQTVHPLASAAYMYDSVMAIGLGACNAQQLEDHKDEQTLHGSTTHESAVDSAILQPPLEDEAQSSEFLDGFPEPVLEYHVQGVLQSDFFGASGRIRFENQSNSREIQDVTVGLYNVRRNNSLAGPNETIQNDNLSNVLTLVYHQNDGGWKKYDQQEFVYRDGTTKKPANNRIPVETNYLDRGVRAFGLILFTIAYLLGFGNMAVLWHLRDDAVIKRSQPFFLQLLCVGCIFLSTAILTLSWDEGAGFTQAQLDVCCAITPWFFFVGQIVSFSALFTRLWRVDKVLQFRRGQTVTILNVIYPLIVLLVLALTILITWSVVDPWLWHVETIREIPYEVYGECQSGHWWAFFAPLMTLIVAAETLSAFFAWKTSDVPEDFRDTNAVFYAICTNLQAWFVGIPILVVLDQSSSNATYFGRVLLTWIFAVCPVIIVIIPKVYCAYDLRRHPERVTKNRVKVSGLTSPATTTVRQSSGAYDESSQARTSYTPSSVHTPPATSSIISPMSMNESQTKESRHLPTAEDPNSLVQS